MATDKLRIQVYVEPELYQKLIEWKEEQGISHISEALNQVMIEKFWAPSQSLPNPQSLPTEQIKEMIEEECSSRMHEIKEHIAAKLPTLTELDSKIDGYVQERMAKQSEEWMIQLGERFYDRIYALEQKVWTLENAAKSKLLSDSFSEFDTPFPPGTTIIDKEGSYGIVIGINNLRMSVDWLGVGSCPNPPTGKGVWYDWVKDDQAIANFKPATHDRINLLTTEELLQFLAWDKNQLGDYWDCKWFDVGSHSIRWGGATVDRWVVVAQGEPDSESDELLNESSSELPIEPSNLPGFLNAANLARRLRVSNSAISRRKCDPTFTEWSKGHDPAGIGWRFPGRGQRFFPVT